MTDASSYFFREFNRALGTPTGRPIAAPKTSTRPTKVYTSPQFQREVAQRVSSGTTDLSTEVENRLQDLFGDAAVGGGKTGKGYAAYQLSQNVKKQQKQIDKEFKKKVKQIEQQIREAKRIDAAYKETNPPPGQDLSKLDPHNAAVMEMQSAQHEGENPLSKVSEAIGKGISLVTSRGQNALLGGINAIATEDTPGHPSKLQSPAEWGKRAWAGLSGKETTDPGQMMERLFPAAPHILKIAGATGITLGADPLNVIGFGALHYAKDTGKLLNEADMIEQGSKALASSVAESGVDVGTRPRNIPGRGGFGNPLEAATAHVEQNAASTLKDSIIDVKSGGMAGRQSLGHTDALASSMASRGAEWFRKWRLDTFDRFVEQYRAHVASVEAGGPHLLSVQRIKNMRAADGFFDSLMNEVDKLGPGQKLTSKVARDAEQVARRTLDKDIVDLTEHMANKVKNLYGSTGGVRIGNKWIKIPGVGKALELVGGKAAKNLDIDAIRKLSHAGQFPGRLALLSQRGRSIGTHRLEQFRREINEFIKLHGFEKDERIAITHAIENNTGFAHNPRLQAGLDYVQQELKRMYDEEVRHGARDPRRTKFLSNYTFVWNRKGNHRVLEDFKARRKKQINSGGAATYGSAANHNISAAKAAGHKPVEDAFDMLMLRQLKSNRDITRALFRSDVVENYGTLARGLDNNAAALRELEPIDHARISENVRNRARSDLGDQWYLPKHHNNVLRDFEDLSRFTTDAAPMKLFRKFTNIFKSGVTVYNPGYHTRNIMSDTMMGILDHVGVKPYYDLIKQSDFKRLPGEKIPRFHPKTGAVIKIGPGWSMTIDDLWDLYKKNAAGGGYFGAEYGMGKISGLPSKINEGVRRASEVREDFGRVAHFLGALRQEYKGGVKTGLRTTTKAQEKAVEQAVYRVNHYKFDYGALTKWEQKWVKPIIPFYTFARKAVPTLMENFMMNPKWLHRYQMMQNMQNQNTPKHFANFALPPWMRQVGYATLADEKEPWVGTFDTLPTDALASVMPADKSVKGFAQNFMNQLNPLLQMAPELASGHETFSGEKIGSYATYLQHKFGGPYSSFKKAQEADTRGLPLWQNFLQSRLGAGLPIHRISENQQEFYKKEWEDQNLEGDDTAPFNEFNDGPGKEKGVHVYTSKSSSGFSSYKVRDDKTGRTLKQFRSPSDALYYAKRAKGTPSLPTTFDDFNETSGKKAHIRIYYSDRKDGNSYRVRNTKTNKYRDFHSSEQAYQYAARVAGI